MKTAVSSFGIWCLGLLITTSIAAADTVIERADFAEVIGTRASSFLAHDLETNEQCVLEDSDLQTRHAPWSTFKIPNFLIALDQRVVTGPEHWLEWDSDLRPAAPHWPQSWRQGQTLTTAFSRSAFWYFQDIANEVGAPSYRSQLDRWGYGNAAVPDGSDDFWLGGPLLVSVAEQVSFLGRLVSNDLGLDEDVLAVLEEVSRISETEGVTLYGKTGSGPVIPGAFSGAFQGWFVGWVKEDRKKPIVFAHHVSGTSYDEINTFRQDFAVTGLASCGFLPESFGQ